MTQHCAVLAGLILAGTWVGAQAPAPPLPVVQLEDQFERPTSVEQYRQHVLVLLFGDRASTTANQSLGAKLHIQFHPTAVGMPADQARQAPVVPVPGAAPGTPTPDVFVIPVACMGKVPGPIKSLVRSQIRRGSPHVPVWIDAADVMKGQFGLVAGEPNVVVLDQHGRLRYKVTGQLDPANYERLVATIAKLRAER
jgi:hypothetical protein